MSTHTQSQPVKDTSYNGWTNYETWLVSLWIDNDQGSAEHWRERTLEAIESTKDGLSAYAKFTGREIFTPAQRAAHQLKRDLKESFDEQSESMLEEAGLSASFWADLIGAALSEVNWREIAENMIDEAQS